jgi:hypothetical protein
MKGKLICVCREASEQNCRDTVCVKHRRLQPDSCFQSNRWPFGLTTAIVQKEIADA